MNASSSPTTPPVAGRPTIDAREATHFDALAADWWNPKGSSAMLHRLNPARLAYVRRAIDRHWHQPATAPRPLAGRHALDVGCGGGLLTEPLARLGATTTGIDGAGEAVAIAAAHARAVGLNIDYRHGEVAELLAGERRFDLITAMEVVEHVADVDAFLSTLAKLLAPGGLMLLSTPNRTARSRLLTVDVAEGLGLVPRGTHDWSRFLTPGELTAHLSTAGLSVRDVTGLVFSLSRGFALGDDPGLNYLVTAVRTGD